MAAMRAQNREQRRSGLIKPAIPNSPATLGLFHMSRLTDLLVQPSTQPEQLRLGSSTFSPTSSVAIAQAPGATATPSYSPAAPATVFGGVRITF
jgi:hypothetical protein